MQPTANNTGYSYGTVTSFPHDVPALTTSNTVTLSGQVTNDYYKGLCFGPAEGSATTGYIALVCNGGNWYIYSVLGLGTNSPVVGKQLATGSYPYTSSTSYDVSPTFGSGTGKLTVIFTQGSASPLVQSFSTGNFTPVVVGYALSNMDSATTSPATIGGFAYMTS
jgi:hypothetical protein